MYFAIITDKSKSYRDFQKDFLLKKWGKNDVEYREVSSLSEVGESTIFGDAPLSLMSLDETTQVKTLLANVQKIPTDILKKKFDSGFIILSSLARNSTKKLEQFITDVGGEVIAAKGNSRDKSNISSKLLSSLSLPKNVKNFMEEYSGDDYDTLISLIRSVSEIPEKQQSRLTIDDIIIRMPQAPGSIPPWEIEKPLMSGDLNETINLYRRIINHSHYLVVLSILKNKILLAYRISALFEIYGKMDTAKVSAYLNVANNYPLKLAVGTVKDLGPDALEKLLIVLLETEAQVKGGSSADSNVVVEIGLARMVEIIRRKKHVV